MPFDEHTINSLRIDRRPIGHGRTVALMMLILMLLGGAGVGGWLWWRSIASTIEVRTIAVASNSSSGSGDRTLLNASGYVTARRHATVSSKVTGKVTEVLIEEGMRVAEGDVLARIDSSNVLTSAQLAEANLDAAKRMLGETDASLAQAQRELERLQEASQSGAARPIEIQRAETLVRTLQARIERQQAEVLVADREVVIWKQNLDDTVIRAPFSGIVTAKNAQPGEMISPMSVGGFTRTGICTIVDMSSLEIEVDVSESYINRVIAGQPVVATLDSYPEWRIPAKVIAIIPTADRQKATVKVRVGFEALDPRILPDMSVKVAFQGGSDAAPRAAALAIPATAVSKSDGRDVAWVVRNGAVERRAVTIGASQGGTVTIAAGLNEGERVVVEIPEGLRDGARVKEARR